MTCSLCKKQMARDGSAYCSDTCHEIAKKIIRLTDKYTPTNGCDNCWGDLGGDCTDECKCQFKLAGEFSAELHELIKLCFQ